MTRLTDVVTYRNFENRLSVRYRQGLNKLLAGLSELSADDQRDFLLGAFPVFIQPYVTSMAEFASTWAEDLFTEATDELPQVTMVYEIDDDAVAATVRWAVGPLFGESGTVMERLDGAGQRLIANAGRESVVATQGR